MELAIGKNIFWRVRRTDELKEDLVVEEREESRVMSFGGIEECASGEELAETVGFPVEDMRDVPLEIGGIHYENLFDEVAQVTMQGTGHQVVFRKARGMEDVSGDYTVYAATKEVKVSDVAVTLKGSDGIFSLALWQKEGYSYSLSMEPRESEDTMMAVVEYVVKQ